MTEKANEEYWSNRNSNTGSATSQHHQGWRRKEKTHRRKCSVELVPRPVESGYSGACKGSSEGWDSGLWGEGPGLLTRCRECGGNVKISHCQDLEALFCMLPGTGAEQKGWYPCPPPPTPQMQKLSGSPGSRETGLADSLPSLPDGVYGAERW